MASRQPNPRASGQVVTHKRKDGLTSWYLRVRAYGRRHRINLGTELDGYTDARARIELQNVLAKIQAGIWEPPGPRGGEHDDPSFHEFASSWLSRRRPAFKERTHEHYRYLLVSHLLPVFARLRVSQLDYAAIDNYVETKQLESDEVRQATRAGITLRGASGRPKRALANSTINATLAAADQSSADHHRWRCLAGSGLRNTELCRIDVCDVDFAHGHINVEDAKTDAGVRRVDLSPMLLDDLLAWRASLKHPSADSPFFPTRTGNRRDKDNINARVLKPAIRRADERRAHRDLLPLPAKVTAHTLRRTYISMMFAAGAEIPYVMAQVGHADSKVTLEIYARVLKRRDRDEASRAFDELLVGRPGL